MLFILMVRSLGTSDITALQISENHQCKIHINKTKCVYVVMC